MNNFDTWKQETPVAHLRLDVSDIDVLVELAINHVYSGVDRLNFRKRKYHYIETVLVYEVMQGYEQYRQKQKIKKDGICPLAKYDGVIKFAKILVRNGCTDLKWVHLAKQDLNKKCCGVCFGFF